MASRARSSATRLRPTIGVVGANPAIARSDSLSPPQKPSSRLRRAYSRHAFSTSHSAHSDRALASRRTLASGRSANGAKNKLLSPMQRPKSIQAVEPVGAAAPSTASSIALNLAAVYNRNNPAVCNPKARCLSKPNPHTRQNHRRTTRDGVVSVYYRIYASQIRFKRRSRETRLV